MTAGGALDAALIAAGVFHGAVVLWLLAGVRRSRADRRRTPAQPAVSVVVAARDEGAHIGACLAALRCQDYGGPLQVVVVDDRSGDDTAAVVARAATAWQRQGTGPDLALVRAPDPPRYACPKKSALAAGIEASNGALLLFTDADCAPPPAWVARLAERFTEDVGLVAGFAHCEPLQRWRHRLLAVDNLGVSALAEGSIGMGAPLSCTGRSLAYRRAVWDQVGGFLAIGHLVSGDDVYFLRLVTAHGGWRVAYCAAEDAAVPGPPGPAALRQILRQKVRHASKAGRYGGGARWLAAAVFVAHVLLLVGAVRAVVLGQAVPAVPVWAAKTAVDAALLWTFAPRERRDRVLLTFLPFVEVLYLPYVLVLAPLGRWARFGWKDRPAPPAHA